MVSRRGIGWFSEVRWAWDLERLCLFIGLVMIGESDVMGLGYSQIRIPMGVTERSVVLDVGGGRGTPRWIWHEAQAVIRCGIVQSSLLRLVPLILLYSLVQAICLLREQCRLHTDV